MTKTAKELYDLSKVDLKAKEELTQVDKKNLQNKKKRNIRKKIKEKEKNTKMKMIAASTGSKFEARIQIKAEKDKRIKGN